MRIWMVFILFIVFASLNFASSIRMFCQQYDVDCTIWLMPLLLTKLNHRLWVMLLPVLLFCDAPFLDEQQQFIIVRTGKKRWAIGQILYIFAASAVFYLLCTVLCALLLFPHIEFSLEWGRVLRTLTQSHASTLVSMDVLPELVLQTYSPLEATLLCGGITWLVTSFLGLLIFFCNLWMRREAGIILAGVIVGLGHFVEQMGMGIMYWRRLRYVSPVSWVNLQVIGKNTAESPSWAYVFAVSVLLNVVLVIAILLSIRRKPIDVVKSF